MADVETLAPEDCEILVAITFHHVPQRVIYLLDVVRALADFPVRRIDIRVMINDVADSIIMALQEVLAHTLSSNATVALVPCRELAHPFALAWAHKRLIPEMFLAEGSPYTHFIYLEDDMRFGFRNFRYFLQHRKPLAERGLIPSFVRVEYATEMQEMRCTDVQRSMPFDRLRKVELDPYIFVSPTNPYCALYVLDPELAREYVATASFDLLGSEQVRKVGMRERAAMGLCWENITRGFHSRYAIPIDPARSTAAAECWVPHLPNNYVTRMPTATGKLPMRSLLAPPAPASPSADNARG